MLPYTFLQNKKTYIAYNNFRKRIFSQLSPKESETILYLLPWVLSVNHPAVPGYIKELKKPFKVYGLEKEREIHKKEAAFKNRFGLRGETSFLRFRPNENIIDGLYTIGSVGTVSQTSRSDCDIWICINKKQFEDKMLHHLVQKINLIKDWFDATLRMPVFFFITDLEDIKTCNYGNIGMESSGSTQKNILKEEFYRTTILICGKIPLWWVCYDEHQPVDYDELCENYAYGTLGDYDFIDLGNLESVDRGEYFGSALWQFNKSLTHPLKSIIKMLLMEMLLVSPREELLCHQFRQYILSQKSNPAFIDPSMFTMDAVLKYNEDVEEETFEFIKKCFYLCYEVRLQSKKLTLKESLCRAIFKKYPIDRKEIYRLNDFSRWVLHEQVAFGDQALTLLLNIYNGITLLQRGITQGISPQDLAIIGRKLSSCLEKRANKVPIVHKPLENLNLPTLIFSIVGKKWRVYPAKEATRLLVESTDIVYCIAYVVWNDIYSQGQVRMNPNQTPVTIQEIMGLAKRIREMFGFYDISSIDFENFLKPERITKMLVVASIDETQIENEIVDVCVIYSNNWGELFVSRLKSMHHLQDFLSVHQDKLAYADMNCYVQRSSQFYEKIIERTKRAITQIILDIQSEAGRRKG